MANLESRISVLEQYADAGVNRVCVVVDDEPVPSGEWAKVLRVKFVEPPNTNQPVSKMESGHGKP